MAGVLVEDYFIEGVSDDAGLFTNIVVTSIASTADHYAAFLRRQIGDGLYQCFDGIWVVSVVGYDSGALVFKDVETPRHTLDITDEGCESFADGFPWNIDRPSCRNGCHGIFDLKGDGATACDGHF